MQNPWVSANVQMLLRGRVISKSVSILEREGASRKRSVRRSLRGAKIERFERLTA